MSAGKNSYAFAISYSDAGGRLRVVVWRRTPLGIKREYYAPPFRPYFFVRQADSDALSRLGRVGSRVVSALPDTRITFRGEPTIRVEVRIPDDVPAVKRKLHGMGVPTYESDIPYAENVVKELGVELELRRVAYFDLEVDWRSSLPTSPFSGENRILAVALVGRDGYERVYIDDDERRMLEAFIYDVSRYDVLCGYNITNFDLPILYARLRKWGLRMPPIQTLDLYAVFSRGKTETVSDRLDDVAKHYLGKGKAHIYESGEEMYEDFLHNRERLAEYVLWDARLCRELDEKFGLFEENYELMRLAGLHRLSDVERVSRVVKAILVRAFRERGYVFPSMRKKKENGNSGQRSKYRGAFVFKVKKPLVENVYVLDFKSLYPRIMETYNMSPETIAEDGDILSEKLRFRSKPEGVYRSVLLRLEEMRKQYKKKMVEAIAAGDEETADEYNVKQKAIKTLLVSFYGFIGYGGSALYDRDFAESVTLTGRQLILRSADIAGGYGFDVLYGDTDSIFVESKNMGEEELLWLSETVNSELREWVLERYHVPPSYYRLEIRGEKIYGRLFFTAQKNYIGYLVYEEGVWLEEPKLVVAGLPVKKINTPPYMKKALDIIYRGALDGKSGADVLRELAPLREALFRGEYDEELVITTMLHEDPDKTSSNQPYYRVGRMLRAMGYPVREGTTVKYVWVDKKRVAPVIGNNIPHILPGGYAKYWADIMRIFQRVFGKVSTNRSLEAWLHR